MRAATVDAAWDAGLRWFDTAPLYGHGLSEQRLGAALRRRPRDDMVVASKVGWRLVPGTDPDTIFVAAPALRPVHDYSRGRGGAEPRRQPRPPRPRAARRAARARPRRPRSARRWPALSRSWRAGVREGRIGAVGAGHEPVGDAGALRRARPGRLRAARRPLLAARPERACAICCRSRRDAAWP